MITIMYSCKGCGLDKRKLQVPARAGMHEDVAAYVKTMATIIGDDHKKVSPKCRQPACDLMIPANGEFVGQQVE